MNAKALIAAAIVAVALPLSAAHAAAPEHTVVITAKRLSTVEKVRMSLHDAGARVRHALLHVEPVQSADRATGRATVGGTVRAQARIQ